MKSSWSNLESIFVFEYLPVYICVHLKCSRSENGEAEFKCERTEDEAEELKASNTVETIGPTEGGRASKWIMNQNNSACYF